MIRRWRSLPELRKPVVDDLELTFALAQRLYPAEVRSFRDWLEALLLAANAAVREAYEAAEAGRATPDVRHTSQEA